jgi:hypothetical protein
LLFWYLTFCCHLLVCNWLRYGFESFILKIVHRKNNKIASLVSFFPLNALWTLNAIYCLFFF